MNTRSFQPLQKVLVWSYDMKGLCHKCLKSNIEVNKKIICIECQKCNV